MFRCFLLLSTCFVFGLTLPQIFTDTYTFCQYMTITDKKLEFPDKLWTIDTKDFLLHFSLCKSKQSQCRNQTSACLIDKQNGRLINLGQEFVTDDYDDSRLISQGDVKCSYGNYSLSVSLQCSDSIKSKPFLSNSDDCNFEITMMHPKCTPKCTQTIAGAYLLDLRAFRQNIEFESNSRKFSLSICGPNRSCNRDTSSCEITNETRVSLADIQSQRINYNAIKNELTARGRFKRGRDVKNVEILIKCDWYADNATNPIYLKPQKQGGNYKFELKSSYGCIVLPHRCRINGLDNSNYDLSELNRPTGWAVSGVPQGSIDVNICGPLRRSGTACSDQLSQVCHADNEKYTNRGAVLSSLTVKDDVVRAVFVSGSRCEDDPHLLHGTNIEFTCSKLETGPRFVEYKNCVTYLKWETTQACPLDRYEGQNCYINDRFSNRNLKKLYNETDQTYRLSPNGNIEIVYNLCGPIHSTCDGFSNVSFCLKKQGREIVVGWDQRRLIEENGRLSLETYGTTCGKVVVNFVCSYQNRAPHITVIEDDCKYNLTVFSSFACLATASFNDCVYNVDGTSYDLSTLSLKDENYVVQGDENLEYLLNVCGPVISNPNALCHGDTMVCLRNKTEFNKKYQFRSLGGVGRPRLVNDSLMIETSMGAYCPGFGHYKSIISFECADQKNAPVLTFKESCVYHFTWKTPEACVKNFKNCVINGTKSEETFDLTPIEKKTMNINVDNKTNRYEFRMCDDSYVRYVNDIPNVLSLKREFVQLGDDSFLIYHLNRYCVNTSMISKIIFKIECSETIADRFEGTSFENCVLNMTLYTHIVCPTKKETPVPYSNLEYVMPTLGNSKRKNCLLVNANTGYQFDIENLHTEEIIFANKTFIMNFDEKSTRCNGFVCENSQSIVPLNTCPTVVFNHMHQLVQLQFSNLSRCTPQDSRRLEIWLKCSAERNIEKPVQDNLCTTVITYNLPDACSLLQQDVVVPKSTIAIVTGTALTVLFLIVAFLVMFYFYKKRGGRSNYISICHDKSSIPVYIKDSSL